MKLKAIPGSDPLNVKFLIIMDDLSTAYMKPPMPGTVSVKGPMRYPRYASPRHSPESKVQYNDKCKLC